MIELVNVNIIRSLGSDPIRSGPQTIHDIHVFKEQHKMRSQLAAQFMPFFSAQSAYFYISRQKVPYFNVLRQNRVVFNCFATKQC